MNICVVGNGFDIRHGYKTKFIDILKSYKEYCNKNGAKNIITSYFEVVDTSKGWLDFEAELKGFLIFTERLDSSIVYNVVLKKLVLSIDKFVNSNNAFLYYENLKSMNYDFFDIDNSFISSFKSAQDNESLVIINNDWLKLLIDQINNDFLNLKKYLCHYLREQVKCEVDLLNSLDTMVIKNSPCVVSFNYTKTLEKYNITANYAHGNYDSNIILGIPFTSEIKNKKFSHFFKTNQTIKYNFNTQIIIDNDLNNHIDIFFIGYSFGVSDHYYFRDVLDYIRKQENISIETVSKVRFYYFYYNEESKNNFISNLREFLGEDTLVRFSAQHRIQFLSYEDSYENIKY